VEKTKTGALVSAVEELLSAEATSQPSATSDETSEILAPPIGSPTPDVAVTARSGCSGEGGGRAHWPSPGHETTDFLTSSSPVLNFFLKASITKPCAWGKKRSCAARCRTGEADQATEAGAGTIAFADRDSKKCELVFENVSPHHTFQSARKIASLAGSHSFDFVDLATLLLRSDPETIPVQTLPHSTDV
jgi:hypothetical protein